MIYHYSSLWIIPAKAGIQRDWIPTYVGMTLIEQVFNKAFKLSNEI